MKLGFPADGCVQRVAERTAIAPMPADFRRVDEMLTLVCDRLKTVVDQTRVCRAAVAEPDPMTEDLASAIVREIETRFWTLQAMEGRDPSERGHG